MYTNDYNEQKTTAPKYTIGTQVKIIKNEDGMTYKVSEVKRMFGEIKYVIEVSYTNDEGKKKRSVEIVSERDLIPA